ncbi:hypothetical protein M422DRAFT_270702, partial [Sphaerobolus stellatus SS14]
CLSDIDITVNEYGFLLLERRFEPTGVPSEYALSRLTTIILTWTCSDDDRLIIIARDYIGQKPGLPGVINPEDSAPWPSSTHRQTTSTTSSSGGEYVLCRKQLLARYAMPWLAAVHKLDPQLYADCVYEFCTETAESHRFLRTILKIVQANLVFSVFGDILTRWFGIVSQLTGRSGPLAFKFLPRLFNNETDSSHRSSTFYEPSQTLSDLSQVDPWSVFTELISSDIEGLERGLSWLRIMAVSAVEIPAIMLKQLFQRAIDLRVALDTIVDLLECTLISIWLKTFTGYTLHQEILKIHASYSEIISSRINGKQTDTEL